jgi:hypothetical protein
MMAPQPDIDDVGQLNRTFPKGPDDHFLVQISGIIDQDVQMSAFPTDSLKEGTYLLIHGYIAGNSDPSAPETVHLFYCFLNRAG